MSFILEALRKSEQERQRQTGPGFAELRPAMARPTFPVWAVALGALLAVNLLVLMIVMLRRDDATAPPSRPASASSPAPALPSSPENSAASSTPAAAAPAPSRTELPSDFYAGPGRAATDEPSRAARDDYAMAEEPAEGAPEEAEPELQPPPRATPSEDGESDARLPTINDVALQGASVPEIHLDIHVYAPQPAARFVFLNNRKYREGDATPEGTTVERITRDGVVLNHRGVRFLLPRQ